MRRTIISWLVVVVTTAVLPQAARGQATTYVPLSDYDSGIGSFFRQQLFVPSPSIDARPQLPRLRPRSVELLTDAVLRKWPNLLGGSESNARENILRHAPMNLPQLRGYMAEALFIDNHPEWKYVRSPNASQHDVTRFVPGRQTPWNGQVKFHVSGDSGTYAKDMVTDYRANRFFVPDDHVKPLRDYLMKQGQQCRADGDLAGAEEALRNRSRVSPMGATSTEVTEATREAVRYIARERAAAYVSLGATAAVAFGPIAWEWANGGMSGNQAIYSSARVASLMLGGLGTDMALRNIAGGALRGGIKGNIITGIVVTMVEVSWLLYERGGTRAFSDPIFYEELAGSVSALTVGFIAGGWAAEATSECGPWVSIPAGLVVAGVTSTVGYIGGRHATKTVIEIVAPQMLRKQIESMIEKAQKEIAEKIVIFSTWSPMPRPIRP